jgi:hypothetical protein
LDRDVDMLMTGKRHDFVIDYDVGFDDTGLIQGIDFQLASRCGVSADLSGPVNDRAMFHCDNSYFLENVTITSHRCKTNTVSNTAFRGFGGPQGMFAIEYAIDDIARTLGEDPLEIRRRNFYGVGERDTTQYGQRVEDNIIHDIVDKLVDDSEYRLRREAVRDFNATSPVLKRGIAMTPVKFGISFTATHLNQAGALVHVYRDGTVHLNHGGTEDRGFQWCRHQWQGGAGRGGENTASADRICGAAFFGGRDSCRVSRQQCHRRHSDNGVCRARAAGLARSRLLVVDRLLSNSQDPLRSQDLYRQAVFLLRIRCSRVGGCRGHPDWRMPLAARRYRA